MIFIMKLGSSFASSAGSSGGNSTTSSVVPRSGGSAGGLAPLSSLNDSPAGAVSVTHSLADGVAPGSSVTRLSNSAIALSLASSAVTTRRMSAAVAVEHARTSATIEPKILLVIASSFAVSVNADWVTSNPSNCAGATSSPPPLAAELGFTRVRPLYNWPKSETSDFGWRDREGARNMIEHFNSPPPHPSPAGGGGSRASLSLALTPFSPKSALVRADAGGLDRRAPLRDLALDEGLQVLGRAPLGRDQSDPELVHAILERRRVHRFDRRVVELLDDGRGRALRHEEGVPGDGFEVGEALLVRGCQRRQERRAVARQQRDAFERVARDLRERAGAVGTHVVDLHGDQIRHTHSPSHILHLPAYNPTIPTHPP